jgi:hypothetical protein
MRAAGRAAEGEELMAKLLRVTGLIEDVHPKGDAWTLEELQALVGGWIEQVAGVSPLMMFVDEEGVLKQKPVNRLATILVRERLKEIGRPLRALPTIVGDALIVDKDDRMH